MSKLTLEEYLDQQKDFYKNHVTFHPQNAFCGSAGSEEMNHIWTLIEQLSDIEVITLVKHAGFPNYVSDVEDLENGRELSENVIDEIDREDFYREYKKIIEQRTK